MHRFFRLTLGVLLLALLSSIALGANTHHHHRHHRHHHYAHWRHRHSHAHVLLHHRRWRRLDDITVTGGSSALVQPVTAYRQTRLGHWWTVSYQGDRSLEIASPRDVAAVNSSVGSDLGQFGIGKVAVADLFRFVRPSMVMGGVRATFHGVRGSLQPGWNSSDEVKEGEFIANTQSMLLRSFNDAHAPYGSAMWRPGGMRGHRALHRRHRAMRHRRHHRVSR